MTDEQFEKLLTVETAKLVMLQNIASNIKVITSSTGTPVEIDWKEVGQQLKYASSRLKQLFPGS